jgi:hypothetical protein
MILGLLYCLAAPAFVIVLARRSLGHGLGALFVVGYSYGIVRANLFDGVSHFAFDLALVALYAAAFLGRAPPELRGQSSRAAAWLKALLVAPGLMFLVPLQHPLVQLVGLRAAVLFLPLVLVGARATRADLERLGQWLVVLNLCAVAIGTVEYFVGVERFFPRNEVTRIIYASRDVGAGGALRIPATFSSAHAFGGVMVATLPFVAAAAAAATGRRLVLVAIAGVTTVTGVFMCGARSPVVHLLAFGALVLVGSRLALRAKLAAALVLAAGMAFAMTNERFQRFTTLADADTLADRVRVSANLGIVDTVLDHPLGAGLARAAGTSIPFFLQGVAAPQIGAENELARIALEQGILGLAIFLAFIADVLTRSTTRNPALSPTLAPLFRFLVAALWGTAFIGTGIMSSIPGTGLLLLMMGVLLVQPSRRRVQARGDAPPLTRAA